jgi:hypothetical protein
MYMARRPEILWPYSPVEEERALGRWDEKADLPYAVPLGSAMDIRALFLLETQVKGGSAHDRW